MTRTTVNAVIDINFGEVDNNTTNMILSLKNRCTESDTNNIFLLNRSKNNLIIVLYDIRDKNRQLFHDIIKTDAIDDIHINKFKERHDIKSKSVVSINPAIEEFENRRKSVNENYKHLQMIKSLRKSIGEYIEKDKENYIDDDIKLVWCDDAKAFRLSSSDKSIIKRIYTMICSMTIYTTMITSISIHDNALVIKVKDEYIMNFINVFSVDLKIKKINGGGYNNFEEFVMPANIFESYDNKSALFHLVLPGIIHIIPVNNNDAYMNNFMFWLGTEFGSLDQVELGEYEIDNVKKDIIYITCKSMAQAKSLFNKIKEGDK